LLLPWLHTRRRGSSARQSAPAATIARLTARSASRARSTRRNSVIAQLGRLKGSVCVTVFKILLALRQDGLWPGLSVLIVCSPYFVAAVLRFCLHLAKTPVLPSDGSSSQPSRPGAPFNPAHPVVLLLACRADGLNKLTWTATFWPLWCIFGLLVLASIAATVLAVGIVLAHDRPDLGQRALFFLCYAFLLTVTLTGLTFLVALAQRLDGDLSVPYEAILSPLIVGYSLLLAMYLVFTIFLPPLLLRDINAQAVDEEELPEEEAGGGSGVIEAVSQQLAPPVLVQHSSTLFRRMGNTAMFERFMGAPNTAPVPVAPSTPGKVNEGSSASPSPEMRVADVEAGEAEAGEAESGEAASAGFASSDEYEALEKDIESWVRTQQQQHRARVRKPQAPPGRRTSAAVSPAAADSTKLPAEVKLKLRRLIALKEQLSAAACAEATRAYSQHGSVIGNWSETGNSPHPKGKPSPAGRWDADNAAGLAPSISTRDGARDGARRSDVEAVAAGPPAAEVELGALPLAAASDESAVASGVALPGLAAVDRKQLAAVETGSLDGGRAGLGGDGLGDDDLDDLDDESKCLICFTEPRDAVLLECGHGGICYGCARRCLRSKRRECPMCRQPVAQVVQIRLDGGSGVPLSPHHTGVVRVRQQEGTEVVLAEVLAAADEDEPTQPLGRSPQPLGRSPRPRADPASRAR